jgi:hypothetical protein
MSHSEPSESQRVVQRHKVAWSDTLSRSNIESGGSSRQPSLLPQLKIVVSSFPKMDEHSQTKVQILFGLA